MHRFFVRPDQIEGFSVTLTGDTARQIFRVLRLRPGERIIVLDDTGWEYFVDLSSVSASQVTGSITKKALNAAESGVAITLYQAMIRPEKFEFVLQKATELGVVGFVPFICERSVANPEGSRLSPNKRQRWERIIMEAAEQCGRGRLPILSDPVDFVEACASIAQPAIIPWEAEDSLGIKSALRSPDLVPTEMIACTCPSTSSGRTGEHKASATIRAEEYVSPELVEGQVYPPSSVEKMSVIIGPEGGFTQEEIDAARDIGILPVTLGKRILRSETAAVATIAAVMYEIGELGG